MSVKYHFDIKGEVHFPNVSDDNLKEYRDTVQSLIFAYSEVPEIKVALELVHHDLSVEIADRIPEIEEVRVLKKPKVVLPKKIKHIGI